jgi:hypothetical protein
MRFFVVLAATVSFAVTASAQMPASVQDDAVVICSAWLMKPDAFAKAWADRGFRPGPGGVIGKSWQSLTLEKDQTSITTSEVTYPDAKSRTCQSSAPGGISLKELDLLLAKIAVDAEFGAFSGEMGEQQIGSERKIVLGTFKRAGANPFVGASVHSLNEFTNIVFFRTDFTKAN